MRSVLPSGRELRARAAGLGNPADGNSGVRNGPGVERKALVQWNRRQGGNPEADANLDETSRREARNSRQSRLDLAGVVHGPLSEGGEADGWPPLDRHFLLAGSRFRALPSDMGFPELARKWPLLIALAFPLADLPAAFAQSSDGGSESGGILGRVRGRMGQVRQRMSDKDPSVRYDPAVLRPGVSRQRIHAVFGTPNATRGEGAAREDVYAFYPDGAKYREPHVSAGTIALAVFTSGISLASREARILVHKSKLTLYRVRYDAQGIAASVEKVPSVVGAEAPDGGTGAR